MLDLLTHREERIISDPQWAKTLFEDVRYSILWLFVRLWLGIQWVMMANTRMDDPAWMETGDAMRDYWLSVVNSSELGSFFFVGWYRNLAQYMLDQEAYTWVSKCMVYSEMFFGIMMIFGVFVGLTAFFGLLLNWNFLVLSAGISNPLLFAAPIFLMLAWKTAGFIGADYSLLNWIGTPWGRDMFAGEPMMEDMPARAGAEA